MIVAKEELMENKNKNKIIYLNLTKEKFDTEFNKLLEKFYDNWYFYQEYKDKLKNSFPFEIKYVSL